jgi:hypothetical protein
MSGNLFRHGSTNNIDATFRMPSPCSTTYEGVSHDDSTFCSAIAEFFRTLLVLATVRYLHPWLWHVFADGAYSGTKPDTTLDKIGQWTIEIGVEEGA